MERDVVIVMAKCTASAALFGMRLERKEGSQWALTWAFPMKEGKAKREGFDQSKVKGSFVLDATYPGCPHCGSKSFYRCGCGKVGCWDGVTRTVKCHWCKEEGELSGELDSLDAGGDR